MERRRVVTVEEEAAAAAGVSMFEAETVAIGCLSCLTIQNRRVPLVDLMVLRILTVIFWNLIGLFGSRDGRGEKRCLQLVGAKFL